MTIGEALKHERIRLGLTQDEMIQGIIHKSHYSKIERGIDGISANSLLKILFAHNIDIDEFLERIKDQFLSAEKITELKLENRLKRAFNNSDKEKVEECLQEVLKASVSKIFRYRVVVSVAIMRNELSELSQKLRNEIIAEFSKKDNWVENVDMLRLLANCIPIFSVDQADNFIAYLLKRYRERPLHFGKNEDRVASICINYLFCWHNCGLKGNQVKNGLDYLLKLDNTNQYLFYRACGTFYKYLYEGNEG